VKIYNTTQGILLQENDSYSIHAGLDWDTFINDDALYSKATALHKAAAQLDNETELLAGELLPPMQSQELWAAGVTYLRSKQERQEESKEAGGGDFYQKVYEAERPELFFKANRLRVVGHGGKVRIRGDSTWNVPEPELALVLTSSGKIVGYTIGNDMSSRSIEGENPLYLPQAKTYDGCAALGPCVYVAQEAFPRDASIHLRIVRAGKEVFQGRVAVSQITRSFEDLVGFLFRECSFPQGAVLMTGTGIVPESPFTLQGGDEISISIDHIGTLSNTVA
jgi:2-dehydro-3-deoxy-D-arabinonate dehydratase